MAEPEKKELRVISAHVEDEFRGDIRDLQKRVIKLEKWQFGLILLAGVLGFIVQATLSAVGLFR